MKPANLFCCTGLSQFDDGKLFRLGDYGCLAGDFSKGDVDETQISKTATIAYLCPERLNADVLKKAEVDDKFISSLTTRHSTTQEGIAVKTYGIKGPS